jgi:hypothetical protein|tara:strand:- start:3460 stop:4101 length:642 start_codon:yes stop_codon:yes gene_type:complete
MPDPGEKKEAKMRQYKKTVKDYKKENFREKEKKSLTTSIGTAGPKVRPDGTTKDDKPKVTAKQKEEFREQEDTYRTKSPGTVGDKYYKNPEGTGTGQGGSGIPVEKKEESSPVISNVTTNTQPQYESSSFGYLDTPTIIPIEEEPIPLGGLTDKEFEEFNTYTSSPILADSGNQLPLLLSAFRKTRTGFSITPKFSLNPRGTLIRGVDVKYKF